MRQGEQATLKRVARRLLPFSITMTLLSIWIAFETDGHLRWLPVVVTLPWLLTIVAAISPTIFRLAVLLVLAAVALFAIWVAISQVSYVGLILVLASSLVVILIMIAISSAFRRNTREQSGAR
jgi:hypothetical protein